MTQALNPGGEFPRKIFSSKEFISKDGMMHEQAPPAIKQSFPTTKKGTIGEPSTDRTAPTKHDTPTLLLTLSVFFLVAETIAFLIVVIENQWEQDGEIVVYPYFRKIESHLVFYYPISWFPIPSTLCF